jgi:hypothetical protein
MRLTWILGTENSLGQEKTSYIDLKKIPDFLFWKIEDFRFKIT